MAEITFLEVAAYKLIYALGLNFEFLSNFLFNLKSALIRNWTNKGILRCSSLKVNIKNAA